MKGFHVIYFAFVKAQYEIIQKHASEFDQLQLGIAPRFDDKETCHDITEGLDLIIRHSGRGSDKRDIKTNAQKDIIMQTYSARQTDILKGNQAEKDKVGKMKK